METATTALVTVVRLDGVPLVVLGLLFWSGNALTLIPLHMLLGIALVLALWALAVLAAVSRVQPGLVALSALWGFVVPVLGLTQDQLLPGPAHWTIRLPHLLVGLTAIALANVLGARIRRHLAAPSGSGGVAEHASLGEIARAAEEAGFNRIGVADHVWRSHYMGTVEGPELECYTTLGFLAASTRRAK